MKEKTIKEMATLTELSVGGWWQLTNCAFPFSTLFKLGCGEMGSLMSFKPINKQLPPTKTSNTGAHHVPGGYQTDRQTIALSEVPFNNCHRTIGMMDTRTATPTLTVCGTTMYWCIALF